jgi:hypothetical protein
MWKAFWSLSLGSPEFVNIFLGATAILAAQTAARYVTKIPILSSKPPDPAATRAAHFDCLRLGLDLSFMGFVTILAVLWLAHKIVQKDSADEMMAFGALFLVVQVFLIILTAFFSAIFDSPETDFQRGIWIPSLIGTVSIYLSIYFFAAVMTALSTGG